MDRIPSMSVQRVLSPETVKHVTAILMNCPEGPTFAVVRIKGSRQLRIHMSKRSFDYLENHLRELRELGEL